MNVVALQPDTAWEDKRTNFDRTRALLARAGPAKGAIVVLPEMFATGFSMNMEVCAESRGGETEAFLGGLAREFEVCLVGGAAVRGRDGKVRNEALVFSPTGQLMATYAKMRPFTPGGETTQCLAGRRPVVFRWNDWKISPFVCYDLRFPELFRKAAAEERPELFIVIANWPAKRLAHWLRLLPARAIENQAYVVGVNRVGADPFCIYAGRSIVVDPHGEILADAGNAEGAVQATLDLPLLRRYREGLPFLEDLKPAK